MTTATTHFCWVKAVPLETADTTEDIRAQRLREALRMPGIKAPPPPDDRRRDPHECGVIIRGGNTNPPPSGNNLMAIPEEGRPPSGARWTAVSYAPGADIPAEAPVQTLVFQPVAGDRCAAARWRLDHPDWFADAAAVSLLAHEI